MPSRQVPARLRANRRTHAEEGHAIEAKAIANIDDLPKTAGKLGKSPSLAKACETRRLLNDMGAGGRGIVIQVGLQTAELIQDIVDLAVERSDINGLRWLLT
jgi:hypothetical protein